MCFACPFLWSESIITVLYPYYTSGTVCHRTDCSPLCFVIIEFYRLPEMDTHILTHRVVDFLPEHFVMAPLNDHDGSCMKDEEKYEDREDINFLPKLHHLVLQPIAHDHGDPISCEAI